MIGAHRKFVIVLASLAVLASPALGHNIFKKTWEQQHTNLRITCNACHEKGKPKTEHNPFGMNFVHLIEDQNLTAQWNELEGDEKKKFEEEVMAPAFIEVLKKVCEMESETGEKYGELILSGRIDGTKLKDQ